MKTLVIIVCFFYSSLELLKAGSIIIKSGDEGIRSSGTCIPVDELDFPRKISKHPAWGIIPGTSWVHPDGSEQHTTCSMYEAYFILPDGYREPDLSVEVLVDDYVSVFINNVIIGKGESSTNVLHFTSNNVRLFQSGENIVKLKAESGFGAWGIDFKIAVSYEDGDPLYDFDGDSMPDWWEIQSGLDYRSSEDSDIDTDRDGIVNKDEWDLRSNPQQKDTDGDGLNDGREFEIGTNILNVDSDSDGFGDSDEDKSGSDPLNPSSIPNRETITIYSGFNGSTARHCEQEGYLPVTRANKIEAWDIIPETSWILPNAQSGPLNSSPPR